MSLKFPGKTVLPQGCSWTVVRAKRSWCCLHLVHYIYTLYPSEPPALPRSQQQYYPPLLCTQLQGAGFQVSLSHETRSGGQQNLLPSWCPWFCLFNLVMFWCLGAMSPRACCILSAGNLVRRWMPMKVKHDTGGNSWLWLKQQRQM